MNDPFELISELKYRTSRRGSDTRISGDTCEPVLPPRKWPRQRRSIATVEAILEATARILEEDGRLNTNVIAERAGVGIATLYQYFDGKTAILAALSRRMREALVRRVKGSVEAARALPLEEGLHLLVSAALEEDRTRPAVTLALDLVEAALPLGADQERVQIELCHAVAGFLAHHGVMGKQEQIVLADDLCVMVAALVAAAQVRQKPCDRVLVSHVVQRLTPVILSTVNCSRQ